MCFGSLINSVSYPSATSSVKKEKKGEKSLLFYVLSELLAAVFVHFDVNLGT